MSSFNEILYLCFMLQIKEKEHNDRKVLLENKKMLYLAEQVDIENLQAEINLEAEQLNQTEKLIKECKDKINTLNTTHIKLNQQINDHLGKMRAVQNSIEHLENIAEKKLTVRLLQFY